MWIFQNKYIGSILPVIIISFLLICIVPITIAIYLNYITVSNAVLELILESIAALCGITYIILAARENILCWIYGSISVIIYSYIFFSNYREKYGNELFHFLIHYHKYSVRIISAIGLQNLTFQFKLFANNVRKFGAPGNRTPP